MGIVVWDAVIDTRPRIFGPSLLTFQPSFSSTAKAASMSARRMTFFSGVLSTSVMSFSSFDTLNTGTLRGGTGTASPVRGLRAMRDLRSLTRKVPKPRISMW